MRLYEEMKGYKAAFVPNKDCSEYAEDVMNYLKRGHLVTFYKPKPIEFFGVNQEFEYHTVLLVDGFVVDVTADPVIWPVNKYVERMGCDYSLGGPDCNRIRLF